MADARDTFPASPQHRPDQDGDECGVRVRLLSASELAADDRLLDTLADRLADRLADDRLLDTLADRLAARLSAPERQEGLVDAREIARLTGKTRRWVYEHAQELGATPLGTGPRPRLGFSPSSAVAQLRDAPKVSATPPLPLRAGVRRRRPTGGSSRTVEELLRGPRVVVGARAKAGRRD